MSYLSIFDCETTGKFAFEQVGRKKITRPVDHPDHPRIVSLAMVSYDEEGNEIQSSYDLIKPEGFIIPEDVVKVHGITTEIAEKYGSPMFLVWQKARYVFSRAKYIIAYNSDFDFQMCQIESCRRNWPEIIDKTKVRCAMKAAALMCKFPNPYGYSDYKWPNLDEAYRYCFSTEMARAHNAFYDCKNTADVVHHMIKNGIWNLETNTVKS